MASVLAVLCCCVALLGSAVSQEENVASCGLVGVTSSPSEPYSIPAISDELDSGITIWDASFEGEVQRTAADAHPHFNYISAFVISTDYRFVSNARTRNFTRDLATREILRNVTVYCNDGTSTKYYFRVPVEDLSPPVIEGESFTISVNSNTTHSTRINEGVPIIVSDNAFELGLGGDLKFATTLNNIVRIEALKYEQEDPNPERHIYSLDLYIDDSVTLPLDPDTLIRMRITASDENNVSSATLEINVSE